MSKFKPGDRVERRSEVRALVSLLGVMLYLAVCGFVGIALWAVLR